MVKDSVLMEESAESSSQQRCNDEMNLVQASVVAALKGNLNRMKLLLEQVNNVDEKTDEAGRTALRAAVAVDADHAYSVVDVLLLHGANPNIACSAGYTPLHVAAGKNNSAIVKRLLEARASTRIVDSDGRNALHFAVLNYSYHNVVKMLCGADPQMANKADDKGFFPVHYAASNAHADVCVLLLETMGLDRTVPCSQRSQQTPFHLAARHGNATTLNAMINFYSAYPSSSSTPNCPSNSLPHLSPLNAKDANLNIPLHYAMQFGHLDCVDALLRIPGSESALRCRNSAGMSPLHLAASNGHIHCLKHVQKEKPQCFLINDTNKDKRSVGMMCVASAGELLSEKVDCTLLDCNGRGFLHRAVYSGNLPLVRLLLDEKKLNANHKDINGVSALHMAAAKGNKELVKLLVEHGVAVYERDGRGMTPGDWAAAKGNLEVLDCLFESASNSSLNVNNALSTLDVFTKASVLLAASEGRVQSLEFLKQHASTHFSAVDPYERTALHLAVLHGQSECVRLLLSACPPSLLNAQDCDGRTALMYSAYSPDTLPSLEQLLSAGASIEVQDKQGNTVLHHVCEQHNEEAAMKLVEYLETSIIDKNESHVFVLQNDKGETALHIAVCSGLVRFVEKFAPLTLESIYTRNTNGRLPLTAAIDNTDVAQCMEFIFALSLAPVDYEQSENSTIEGMRRFSQGEPGRRTSGVSVGRKTLNISRCLFDSEANSSNEINCSPSSKGRLSTGYIPRLTLPSSPSRRHSDILPSAQSVSPRSRPLFFSPPNNSSCTNSSANASATVYRSRQSHESSITAQQSFPSSGSNLIDSDEFY